MSLTIDAFKEWLEDGIEYSHSDRLPTEDIFTSINKAQMAQYWKFIVQRVRSRSVADHIRANLLLEKHRRDLTKANDHTNSTMGLDFTLQGELERDEMRQDHFKCEKRLKHRRLELSTLGQETTANLSQTFKLFQTVRTDESEVRNKIRATIHIDKEAKRYSALESDMKDLCKNLETWKKMAANDEPFENSEAVVKIAKDLKIKLAEIVCPDSGQDGAAEALNLLDTLKHIPAATCNSGLVNLLRDLVAKIEAELTSTTSTPNHETGDHVKHSLASLWRRHVEATGQVEKIEIEREKVAKECQKKFEVLKSLISEQNPVKAMLLHYIRLLQLRTGADSMILNLRSQIRGLMVDTRSQIEAVGHIEKDFITVKENTFVLEQKRALIHTMLVQASGLSQRIAVFQNLIEENRLSVKFSIPPNLSSLSDFPANFLAEFEESAFAPKTTVRSNTMLSDDLMINRFSPAHPDLDLIFFHLESFFPVNPSRILEILMVIKKKSWNAESSLENSQKLHSLFHLTDSKNSKSESLKRLLSEILREREKLIQKYPDNNGWKNCDEICQRVMLEIEHWKTEPAKDVAKSDDLFHNPQRSVMPLSKWYQEFYAHK